MKLLGTTMLIMLLSTFIMGVGDLNHCSAAQEGKKATSVDKLGASTKEVTKIDKSKFLSIYPERGIVFKANGFQNERSQDNYWGLQSYTARAGYSNAFIVPGDDFEQTLNNTHRVLFENQSCDSFELRHNEQCWLFVSLGASLTIPRNKAAGPVEFDRKSRRLVFTYLPINEESESTEDVAGFVYWVPLGYLEPGEYSVQLTPQGKARPTFTRTVSVRSR